jgi:hypothetical protein
VVREGYWTKEEEDGTVSGSPGSSHAVVNVSRGSNLGGFQGKCEMKKIVVNAGGRGSTLL